MTKRPENINSYSLLEERLCRHFHFNPEKVGYIELAEMRYIYQHLQITHMIASLHETLALMDELFAASQERGRRRRLHALYLRCQTEYIQQTHRAAPVGAHIPLPISWHDNDG